MCKKIFIFFIFISFCEPLFSTDLEKPIKNIILIGWDGAQREHVKQCLAKGELPNLQKLIDDGKIVDIDIEGVTDTKAGWSQILTGYYPDKTGVYSNVRYQPIPIGFSVFERLENHFVKNNFVTVAVIGKRSHCGEIRPPQKIRLEEPLQKKVQPAGGGAEKSAEGVIVEEKGVKYRIIPGSPYYNMYKALEVWEYGLMQDKKVGDRAVRLLQKYRDNPFFFFVHFAEIDHKGHSFGENSKEYNDALISADHWTGQIMDRLKKLGLYEKTLIYVTADHGFDEDKKAHKNAPYVFLATNDKGVVRNGRRQDVAPTIFVRFGLDLAKISPPLDGLPLTVKTDTRPPAKLGPKQAPAKTAQPKKAA